jgi:NAD+ kinase
MALAQLGLVVHPRRDIAGALDSIADWASTNGVAIGQVRIPGQARQVGEPVDVESCDLLVAVGGDGTTLAALHAAAPVSLPVLGVACGSVGVLTSMHADGLVAGLDQVAAGSWIRRALPGLEVATVADQVGVAINDFAVIRNGMGQVIAAITVDGELYARMAGDGVVVASQLGSSAYTMAAGGPILAPAAQGMVVTPLAAHGGVAPPLVVGPESRVGLSVEPGFGGIRCELDGQEQGTPAAEMTVSLRPDYATLVELHDQESMLTGLRRRGLVVDSPRILARDARAGDPHWR